MEGEKKQRPLPDEALQRNPKRRGHRNRHLLQESNPHYSHDQIPRRSNPYPAAQVIAAAEDKFCRHSSKHGRYRSQSKPKTPFPQRWVRVKEFSGGRREKRREENEGREEEERNPKTVTKEMVSLENRKKGKKAPRFLLLLLKLSN